MRVMVVGSGGREHALAWKLAQSSLVNSVFVAPGNAGTAGLAQNVSIPADDVTGMLAFAERECIDLTVVGPEVPLVAGLVDRFQEAGLRVFGPTRAAAQLEGSKAFAKRFMIEEGVPTAPAMIFSDYDSAHMYLQHAPVPVVVKASGLASGKGVVVCQTREEAEAALHWIMVDRVFGSAGNEVLIEDCLVGEEVSLLAFCDGRAVRTLPAARDYKRALDGDRGGNTGGMGGFAPSPALSSVDSAEVVRRVLQPAVDGLRRRGTPYVGVLYAGLIMTDCGPRVLEFNCRFGDPETQLQMPLLQSDLVELMLACIDGRLERASIEWSHQSVVGIVLASQGYPGSYETGKAITGLREASQQAVAIFHAGTSMGAEGLVTSGGRVLTVVASGRDISEARAKAYHAADLVSFEGKHYRHDIALGVDETVPKRQAGSSVGGGAYQQAGVDIDAADRAKQLMKKAVQSTYTANVLGGMGAFGGSLSLKGLPPIEDVVLVASTDGVGTKTMIAASMGIYDTVGQDIVNHSVNDVLVQGARPLFFLDYVASARLDPDRVAAIVAGCAVACREVGCVLIGGETAEMPGVYEPGTFDLAGTLVGWVRRNELLDGSRVRPGDVCIGLYSSGLHTNGYSLARRVFGSMPWDSVLPELAEPLGKTLLTPHRAYLRHVETLWRQGVEIRAMAHLTGGSFVENIPRVLPDRVGVNINCTAWRVPAIFRLIQERGKVDPAEMYRVFNMGIGMIVIVPANDAAKAVAALPGDAVIVGETICWDGQGPRVSLLR